ncbi:MAG TPA: hypothetical protein PLI53_06020 [Geobacteraceae bacterium]|nr:hypothetical protein [Geobacteraceae bacterium]
MTDHKKDTKSSEIPKEAPLEYCEICGAKLERDPESGEYYCPVCFYSEQES